MEDINKIFKGFSKHYRNEALKDKKESDKWFVYIIIGSLVFVTFLFSMC